MTAGTILAMVVYHKVPFHRFYRVAWFTPMLVSGVIVGIVFRWVFDYDWGLLNSAFRAVGLNTLALNWLGRLDTPIWVVIAVHFWSTLGYSFVLLLAGLTAIPVDLMEAAYIDGASRVRAVWHVLLPLLRPTWVTVLILSFMGKMNTFNVVWVLTNGGPMHASETVATYIQKRAFGWNTLDLGYPAALSVVWFGVVLIGVSALRRLAAAQGGTMRRHGPAWPAPGTHHCERSLTPMTSTRSLRSRVSSQAHMIPITIILLLFTFGFHHSLCLDGGDVVAQPAARSSPIPLACLCTHAGQITGI